MRALSSLKRPSRPPHERQPHHGASSKSLMFGRPPRRPLRHGDELWLSLRALAAAGALFGVVVYWALVIVD